MSSNLNVPNIYPVVLVVDEKTQNTAGGTFSSGAWRTRDLNTLRINDGSLGSVASNQITLPAGVWECWISAPAFDTSSHQIRLQDTTAASTIITGTSQYDTSASSTTRSFIYYKFTLTESSALEVQHRAQTTQNTNGFGVNSNFGVVETYTMAKFRRVR